MGLALHRGDRRGREIFAGLELRERQGKQWLVRFIGDPELVAGKHRVAGTFVQGNELGAMLGFSERCDGIRALQPLRVRAQGARRGSNVEEIPWHGVLHCPR